LSWQTSLFDLYPHRTISRFMYTPDVGIAVLVAWLLTRLSRAGPLRILRRGKLVGLLIALFLLFNLGAVYKMSGLYLTHQKTVAQLISDLREVQGKLVDGSSIGIEASDPESLPDIIRKERHLEAVIDVVFDAQVSIVITYSDLPPVDSSIAQTATLCLRWDAAEGRLVESY
jgi:hypothetical protein